MLLLLLFIDDLLTLLLRHAGLPWLPSSMVPISFCSCSHSDASACGSTKVEDDDEEA
jgi:hypothetical protein